jgi:Flp pilus assembly protein TadG
VERRAAARAGFRRDQQGQTLVVIALVVTVLLGAMALGIDWGYGLTQRRAMQNAADAGALGAARLLAGNALDTEDGVIFAVYERQLWCTANGYADSNRAFRPSGATDGLTIEVSATNAAGSYTAVSSGASGCTGGPFVNPATRFVRARASVNYQSFVAGVVGQPRVSAAATAIARITGAPLGIPGPSWPMVRHFDAADFASNCGNPCNPTSVDPVTFWSSNEDDAVYGQFKALVDTSRYSPNSHDQAGEPACTSAADPGGSAGCVPQLITQWDRSGAAPTGKPNLVGGSACSNAGAVSPGAPSGIWYTNGNENSHGYDKACSASNWFAYLFRGTFALDSDWRSITWNGTTENRERPSTLSATRQSCADAASVGLPAPSCASGMSYLGDWVDVGYTGDLGSNIQDAIRAYISANGRVHPVYSSMSTGNGAGAPLFGKYVVVLVYLWDCAETYRGADPAGSQWSLTRPRSGSDCSTMHRGNDIDSHDTLGRVHLFSAAPFTFYEGLVDSSSIKGFWGGLIADPSTCSVNPSAPGCAVNAFSNGAFLAAGPEN